MSTHTVNRSSDNIPQKIKTFNFGPLFFTVLWCLFNGFYGLALISILPGFGFCIGIYLAFYGNQLAWNRDKHKHQAIFISTQKKWNIAGILFGCLLLISTILVSYETYDINYGKTHFAIMHKLNNENKLTTILGKEIKEISYISFATYNVNGQSNAKYAFTAQGSKAKGYVNLIESNNETTYLSVTTEDRKEPQILIGKEI